VKFLSLAYGYDISSKVALKYQPWTDSDLDRWSGPYFYRDTEEEDKDRQEEQIADWAVQFDALDEWARKITPGEERQLDLFGGSTVAGLRD
jgi:hypothetical protein